MCTKIALSTRLTDSSTKYDRCMATLFDDVTMSLACLATEPYPLTTVLQRLTRTNESASEESEIMFRKKRIPHERCDLFATEMQLIPVDGWIVSIPHR